MKIQPTWVLGGVVLLLMFLGARYVVGAAIEGTRQEAPAQAQGEAGTPTNGAVDRAERARVWVLRPADMVATLEELPENRRQRTLDVVRRLAGVIDQRMAAGVAPEARAGVIEAFQKAEANERAVSVRADLERARKQLAGWWSIEP